MKFVLKNKDGGPMTSHGTAEEAKAAVNNIQAGVTWSKSASGNLTGWLDGKATYTIEREL